MSPNWRLTTASGRRIVARTSTLIVAIVLVSSGGTHRAYPKAGNRDCRADRLCYNRRPRIPARNRVDCAIDDATPCARAALPQYEPLEERLPLDAIEALTTRASPLALTEPAPDAGA